jgi:hypothetical protein
MCRIRLLNCWWLLHSTKLKLEYQAFLFKITMFHKSVAALALGLRPMQGRMPRGKPETHISCSQECGRVCEWTLTLPSEFPFWELESWWSPESSKSDCRSQNPSDWKVPYIIRKILECKCLKWACMTHLDIWNTSYGPTKSRESQFWEFQDSHLGVLGQNSIWMLVSWPITKYTIRGKVMVSPKSRPWWVLWV